MIDKKDMGDEQMELEQLRVERRNFMFTSSLLMFLLLSHAEIKALGVSGIAIVIKSQIPLNQWVFGSLWILWSYFLLRFTQFILKTNVWEIFQREFYDAATKKTITIVDVPPKWETDKMIEQLCKKEQSKFLDTLLSDNVILIPNRPGGYTGSNYSYYQANSKIGFCYKWLKLWLYPVFFGFAITEYFFPYLIGIITIILEIIRL